MPLDSGSGSKQTTVNNTEPWSEQKKYLAPAFASAAANYSSGAYAPNAYQVATGNSGVANFSPEQQQAMAGTTARATAGSPLNAASSQYLQNVLGGQYLNADNPYLRNIAGQAASAAKSQYSQAGRYGSNASDQGIANAVAPIYYQDYNNQLGRMDQAAALAPTIANQDYVDLQALYGVGQNQQDQAQKYLDEQQQVYNYQAGLPATSLNTYLGQIGGNYGQTSTQQTPYYGPSGLQQGIGAGVGLLGALGSYYYG